MAEEFDLKDFQLKQPFIPPVKPTPHRSRHRPGELFLKGPIPARWLYSTFKLKRHATQMAIHLWILAGMRGSHTFRVSLWDLPEGTFTRWTAYRALRELERAQLISVERKRGRQATVTILL
jgi:hypothetical protein